MANCGDLAELLVRLRSVSPPSVFRSFAGRDGEGRAVAGGLSPSARDSQSSGAARRTTRIGPNGFVATPLEDGVKHVPGSDSSSPGRSPQ